MSSTIQKNVASVLWRIVIFLIYYTLLIVCGIALICLAVFVTQWIFCDVVQSTTRISVRGYLGIFLCLFIMWGVVGMFAIYLIKPLFSFSRNRNPERVEITEQDAPLLFQCINELAHEVGCKTPKHVYLTANVNACVFYNTSFWSIFFPVRKNLEIGLGLFQDTSVEEIRSIIGHEFGHFAQGSMKVGSTVYVVNSILYNLVFAEDFYERWLKKLCQPERNRWIRAWGRLTYMLTSLVKRMNMVVYKMVQRAYLKLSRQMEFDADNVSAHVVGKEAFISALCKIDILGEFQSFYENLLCDLGNEENATVDNFWKGGTIVKELSSKDFVFPFDFDTQLTAPVMSPVASLSRISFEDAWSTHPSLESRLANIAKSNSHSVDSKKKAWDLIPESLSREVSQRHILLLLLENTEVENLEDIKFLSTTQFRTWAKNQLDQFLTPLNLAPFFSRIILSFELTDRERTQPVANPFTFENALILSEYETALSDRKLMEAIASGKVEAREFTYNNQSYSTENLPMETHKAYTLGLREKAIQIDKEVCLYLMQHSDKPEEIDLAYSRIFAATEITIDLQQIADRQQVFVDKWNSTNVNSRTEKDFKTLLSNMKSAGDVVVYLREHVKWNLLDGQLENEDNVKLLKQILDEAPELNDINTIDEISHNLNTISPFMDAYDHINQEAKRYLIQEAKNKHYSFTI